MLSYRIPDFGGTFGSEDAQTANAQTYLFLATDNNTGYSRATFTVLGVASEAYVDGPMLAIGFATHFAVVVDGIKPELLFYIDGGLQGTAPLGYGLANLYDVNNWLGRSQYTADPEFGGLLYEVRIYSDALSGAQIEANFAVGPDVLPGE